MNFLGHLYFSDNNAELMYANLFGDYVKGRNYTQYPEIIQKGVKLHREIDNYIDQHPRILELLRELYPVLPKISGIAVDLIFDHLLAKNWSSYHDTNFKLFVDNFYTFQPNSDDYFSVEFNFMLSKMREHNWIFQYREIDGLRSACTGLSNRMKFPNKLDYAPEVFLEKEKLITEVFEAFMTDATAHFNNYIPSLEIQK